MSTLEENFSKESFSWRLGRALAKGLQEDSKLAPYVLADEQGVPCVLWNEKQEQRLRALAMKQCAFIALLPPLLVPFDTQPNGFAAAMNAQLRVLVAVSDLHGEQALELCCRMVDAVYKQLVVVMEADGMPLMVPESIAPTSLQELASMENWSAQMIVVQTKLRY